MAHPKMTAHPHHVEFRFCPVCGGRLATRSLKENEPDRMVCSACEFVFYLDPKVVACAIVEWDGKIVLLKRYIDPQKGKWVIPGGYVDRGEEVKSAMERAQPMDLLICGDVGYGKTEIAIRAAFKAVQDGKQVAVLAPTTVLVEQHLQTFRERLADYPVVIESLSRFRTSKQQEAIVASLAASGESS